MHPRHFEFGGIAKARILDEDRAFEPDDIADVIDFVEYPARYEPERELAQAPEPGFWREAIRVVVAAIRKPRALLRSRTPMCSCSAYARPRQPDASLALSANSEQIPVKCQFQFASEVPR